MIFKSKYMLVDASNLLTIQQWSDEGFGTSESIFKQLRHFHSQKVKNAKGKNIKFLMTFDEHCKMLLMDWFGKPVFTQIGTKSTDLCLQRNEDVGPYAAGNCWYGFTKTNNEDSANRRHNNI